MNVFSPSKSRIPLARAAAVLAIASFGCGPGIPVKVPRYPEGNMGDQLKAVMGAKRKIGVIAVEPNPTLMQRIGTQMDWSSTVEASLTTTLTQKGFYTLLDMSSRKARLRELAYTQTGLTGEQRQIGTELAADGLLFIRMTNPPLQECKTEMIQDYAGTALRMGLAAMARNADGAAEGAKKEPTGVLYLTVFLQGTIVNLESGRSVTYAHSKPYKLQNEAGNPECPSTLDAFSKALEDASSAVADNLSPTIVTVKIPLAADADDVEGDQAEKVTQFLEEGNKWAEENDFEMAAQAWEKALDASGGKSASALWNIAAFKWYTGDMDGAEKYFKRSFSSGGSDWLDGAKRSLWSTFRKEKERKENEGDN
jgi:tetratricopeptide (TPR) repeat protein